MKFSGVRHPRHGAIPSQSEARNDCAVWCAHTDIPLNSNLWQHRTIASASLRRLFAPLLPFEKPEIHTGFETVEKGLRPFLTKGLQSAARTSCPLTADKTHTCSLSCIFCQVHAPTENDQNPFAACGRQTLRGFFDTLKSTAAFVLRRCFHGNVTRGTGLPRRQSG